MTGGNIFPIKGALQKILLGTKDERECALDASLDGTKADWADEAFELFSFFSCVFVFLDAEVSKFSDEGWVSKEDSECDLKIKTCLFTCLAHLF